MILKVQLSLASSDGQRRVLAYNSDKSVLVEFVATKQLVKQLSGKPKSFWEGSINGTMLELQHPVAHQNW